MRKFIFTLVAVVMTTAMFSQEDEGTTIEVANKNGIAILPIAGDFAIGIDATPIFNFVGNMIKIDNGATFNDPMSFDYVNGGSIYGKYFLTANSAVRARVNIGMGSVTLNNLVADDANIETDPDAKVTDTWKASTNMVNLGLGYEMRRGKGRLQAFYGGELNLSFGGGTKDVYTYGNAMNNNDSLPTTTAWPTYSSGNLTYGAPRPTEVTIAGGFGFGLRGFVGVEYFIFPNISLGGEFGWGLNLNSTGEGMVNTESWDTIEFERTTTDTPMAGRSGFNLGNDNFGGNVFLLFHF